MQAPSRSRWKRALYENSLLIVIGAFALASLVGQTVSGWHVRNHELEDLGQAQLSLGAYIGSGHWLEATFENWESEFLQMGMYVLLTVWLRQKGSSESKELYGEQEVDRDGKPQKDAPWPVRRGGWALRVYRNSLALAFFLLFALSIWLHAVGGAKVESVERVAHGQAPIGTLAFMTTSQFWFESTQNWQSEFFSIVALIGFSIFLRQQGSAQSKPVDAPNSQTGC